MQGTDTVNRLENNEKVHMCVHTVWEYVESWSEEGSNVGLIYLFMKSLKLHLCPKYDNEQDV